VFVNALLLDGDENIYIAGDFEGTVDFDPGVNVVQAISLGAHDSYVAKYSPTGELIWAKFFGAFQQQGITGMDMDNEGNLIFTGNFQYTVDFDANDGVAELTPLVNESSEDVFVAKWTSNGEFVWVKQLGGMGSQSSFSMALDTQDNILITGNFTDVMDCDPDAGEFLLTPIGTNFTAFIVKLSSNAEFLWAKQIGDGSQDIGMIVKTDDYLNIYYAGHFDGTVDFDGGLNGGELTAYGSRDVFICKLAFDGSFLWVSRFGGAETEHPVDMDIDTDGNVYVTGFFQATCDFDPSDAVQNLSVYGQYDGFISVLNTGGVYQWAARLGNNFYDSGISITVTDDYIYELGVFAYGCYLDPENPNMISVEGSEDSHGYIAKYTHPALGSNIEDNRVILPEIFPNPAHEWIILKGLSSSVDINVTDINGKTVLRMKAMGNTPLDVHSLSDGVYMLHFTLDGIAIAKRFIKH
ncbi:MAG: T9SS type A sorting domain-containing protein, partial [Flavobacteriales bacterium]